MSDKQQTVPIKLAKERRPALEMVAVGALLAMNPDDRKDAISRYLSRGRNDWSRMFAQCIDAMAQDGEEQDALLDKFLGIFGVVQVPDEALIVSILKKLGESDFRAAMCEMIDRASFAARSGELGDVRARLMEVIDFLDDDYETTLGAGG